MPWVLGGAALGAALGLLVGRASIGKKNEVGTAVDLSIKGTDWADQTVLVTGSNRGLGLEFTRQLLDAGANLVATCRDKSRATELQILASRHQGRCRIVDLDVSSWSSIDAMFAALTSDGVVLDIIINNAGVATPNHPVDPILTASRDDMLNVWSTNVLGTVRMMQAGAPLMAASRRSGGPAIVNLGSDLGAIANVRGCQGRAGGVGSYRLSKASLSMATATFAAEAEELGLCAVVISPGWVATDMGSAGGRSPPTTPQESSAGVLAITARLTMEHSGKFFKFDNTVLPW